MGAEAIEGQVQSLLRRLDEIAELGDNWDSRGAKRIDPAVIKAAKWYIETHCGKVKAVIYPRPSPSGDIQLEWHRFDGDVLVCVSRDKAEIRIFYDDLPANSEPAICTVDVPFLGDDGEVERVINQCLLFMPLGTKRHDVPGEYTILAWQCVRVFVTGRNGEHPTMSITVDATFDKECDSNLLSQAVYLSTEFIKGGGMCAD